MFHHLKYISLTIIFAALFTAGFTKAAWRDAPAGPPNYGLVSPDTQADYRPMHLGSANQTKSGGANFAMDAGTKVGIGGVAVGTAKLSVSGGASGDALASYSNSANSAIYAEQQNTSGYAIYASGKLYVNGEPAQASDFVGYSGTTPLGYIWPNNHIPEAIFTRPSTGVISGVGGQLTYRGGIGLGPGVGIYSVNPNPAGSPYYGDIRFHTAWWDGSDYRNSDRMVITQNGNVGIGTTSPGVKLHVGNGTSGSGKIRLQGFSASGRYADIGYEGDNFSIGDSVNGTNLFIQYNGNVGIGTTAPAYKLDVAGDVNITGTYRVNGAPISAGGGITASTINNINYIPKWTSDSSLGKSLIIDSGSSISVSGDVSTTGSGTAVGGWFVSSDARLKKNVETLSGALDKIGRVRGVSYDLASGQGARQIGVIAQELEREFPELVATDGNGYKAVAYDKLSAVLIEAIKELQSQNQALKSRLDQLSQKW